jgi:cytochrome c553
MRLRFRDNICDAFAKRGQAAGASQIEHARMKDRFSSTTMLIVLLALSTTGISPGQGAAEVKGTTGQAGQPSASAPSDPRIPAAIAAARERARLLHDVYSATLDIMHRHYFRPEGAVLPARAMEDLFEDMAQLSEDKARWISVNTKAMSIQHAPATPFEKKAAAELSAGKEEYELVENGVYQRAGVIPLRAGCVSCHTKHFSGPFKSPRLAGLVISIPLNVPTK